MAAGRKLVIVGVGELAEMAHQYFSHDSPHEVAGFAVERQWLRQDTAFGLPVVAFEDVEQIYPPSRFAAHVAVGYRQLNRLRARLYAAAKGKGYELLSYVSSRAFVWHSAAIGDNCLVFEGNVLQHQVAVGDDVVLWSGNHLGHGARIGNHCFVSSHVVVAGYAAIGDRCFLGVNCSIADRVVVAEDCVIGGNAMVLADTQRGGVYRGNPAAASPVTSFRMFGIARDDA